ncbi:MAG: c-type cytochrome, partial [Deltaproteobacteria bacterium]|nr:c-type cytochrome [Deltaproteobacteria bacterium]
AVPYLNEGRLLVYKLGGSAPLPPVKPRPAGVVDAPPLPASPETLERGEVLYSTRCARCHGFFAVSTGFHPDLRHASRAVHENWDAIVLQGAFESKGMTGFAGLLSEDDSAAIHAYVVDRALSGPSYFDMAMDWLRERVCIPTSWMVD